MTAIKSLVILLLATTSTFAQELSTATPESVGLSSEALQRATLALQTHVDNGSIAGVVAAVVRDGNVVYSEALGYRTLEQQDPMPNDAIFRQYSMTRPITSVAAMILWEGWDGSAGTRFFIDPEQDMITVIMAQVSPARGNGFREEFSTLVDAAIVDRR